VSYADYDLNPLRLALDLASLGEEALDFGELVERQRRMFTDHGYDPGNGEVPGSGVAASLTGLGAELAAVLGTQAEGQFLDALSALLDAQDCRPYLTRHDGVASPHLHYARDGAPLAEWMSSMAVTGLVLYVCRNGRSRLHRCAAEGCGRWFADTSRNRSRRYCSGTCASRTTVAAFRARQR
jgi:CGNR zinc finger